MDYQAFVDFPFIDFGALLIMLAVAIQILRGKFTLTGGLLELIKTNKSAFDQDSDPLVIQLAQIARMEPAQMRRFLETGYLLATGEQMNIQARATLAEAVPPVTGLPLAERYRVTPMAPTSAEQVAVGLQEVAAQYLEDEPGASG